MGCFGSLQGKKSPVRRFFYVDCAKRNKLLGRIRAQEMNDWRSAPCGGAKTPLALTGFSSLVESGYGWKISGTSWQ
jgi:hypothetical protein